MPCDRCKSNNLIRDDTTGCLVCAECGTLQPFDNYDAQLGGFRGPQGTSIRVGFAGTGSVLDYKEKKIFEAQNLIEDLTSKLNLTNKLSDIKTMVKNVTDGEFGLGDWFPVLVGACSYVVMRMDDKNVLPLEEVSAVIGCDIYELGNMIGRVVEHLQLELPEVDLAGFFMRAVKNSTKLSGMDRDKKEKIMKQGVFLMNCAIKWFLSTGRRPLPLVVAVLAFVTEVNGVPVQIKELAKEVQVPLSTCKKRHKELLEKLVMVAQKAGFPWGKDITVKNIVNHAAVVIGYMEAKSMKKSNNGKENELAHDRFDFDDVVKECLAKDIGHWNDDDNHCKNESRYYEVGNEASSVRPDFRGKISQERLSMIHKKFADEVGVGKLRRQSEQDSASRRRRGFELVTFEDWWKGKSEMSQKLLLKEILEKDVGLDALPPAYTRNQKVLERRREKINAAKLRINKIVNPNPTGSGDGSVCSSIHEQTGKNKRKRHASDIDWEDLVIETLLLHQVKEEDVETGHYNTLLDLHVFNSGDV